MRILICGDRYWKNENSIRTVLEKYPSHTIIIEGECRGADKLSRTVAESLGMKVIPFEAKWSIYGLGAGHIRNQQMLDEGKPDKVIAFHPNIDKSKGTKDMIKKAKKAGIPVTLITK